MSKNQGQIVKKLTSVIDKTNIALLLDNLAYLSILLFTLAAIIVSIGRYNQFETFYYDFGIFDQAIYRVSQFKIPIIDHYTLGGKHIFADHFHPSIFTIAPLYWIFESSKILLVVQAVSVGLSSLVLYQLAKKLLNNKFFALSILCSYILFIGLQNAIITDFHPIVVATLPIMMLYQSVLNDNKKLFWPLLIFTLGFKESLFIHGISLAVFIYPFKKEWRKQAIITCIISLIWGLTTIKLIIPFFSQGAFIYKPGGQQSIITVLARGIELKLYTTLNLFQSFLFLPLLIPQSLLIVFTNLLSRFIIPGLAKSGLGLHYNAEIAPILAVSTMLVLKKIKNGESNLINTIKKITHLNLSNTQLSYLISTFIIINSLINYRFIYRGPLALAYNPTFYKHTKKFNYLENLIQKVPSDNTVMTHNNLAVRFTHQDVKLLRLNYEEYQPHYIVLDLRDGQNPNNFYGIDNINLIHQKIKQDQNYQLLYHQGDQYIYQLKSEL